MNLKRVTHRVGVGGFAVLALLVFVVAAHAQAGPAPAAATSSACQLQAALELDLGQKIGQLRAAPVQLGGERALLLAYAADFDVDPFHEMFFYPTDTIKIAVYTLQGRRLWQKDLSRGMPPGVWFCPVFPFDLDGDGVDEIWCIGNSDADHPLGVSHYRLERLDGRTGKLLGTKRWPAQVDQPISHMFRNFIFGGHVHGEPVLITAQGTYGAMNLQAWRPDLTPRWEHAIPANSRGARGSHMCPVVDFNGDGVEEVLWGERLIELDTGKELFCADREGYRGHTDIVEPFFDTTTKRWSFFTCRESDPKARERIVAFDQNGQRLWGALDRGHIDMGWVAHLNNPADFTAMSIRIGKKTLGPEGRFRTGTEEFVFDAATGTPIHLPFKVYETMPVDLNGDGVHELVYGQPGGSGDVIDGRGAPLGHVGGTVALAAHLLDAPGEHLVCYYKDGKVKVWRDMNAKDTDVARRRYAHPYYLANMRLATCGYNLVNLGGL